MKSKITITFDETTGFPSAKCRNISVNQLADAGIFLRGKSTKRELFNPKLKKAKKENVVHKFFRCLAYAFSSSSDDIEHIRKEIVTPFPIK